MPMTLDSRERSARSSHVFGSLLLPQEHSRRSIVGRSSGKAIAMFGTEIDE